MRSRSRRSDCIDTRKAPPGRANGADPWVHPPSHYHTASPLSAVKAILYVQLVQRLFSHPIIHRPFVVKVSDLPALVGRTTRPCGEYKVSKERPQPPERGAVETSLSVDIGFLLEQGTAHSHLCEY